MVPAKTGWRCETCARERHAEIMAIRAKYLPGAARRLEVQPTEAAIAAPAIGRMAEVAVLKMAVETVGPKAVVEAILDNYRPATGQPEVTVADPKCEKCGDAKTKNARGRFNCMRCWRQALSAGHRKARAEVVGEIKPATIVLPKRHPGPRPFLKKTVERRAKEDAAPRPRKPKTETTTSDLVTSAQEVARLSKELDAAKAHLRELLDQ